MTIVSSKILRCVIEKECSFMVIMRFDYPKVLPLAPAALRFFLALHIE